MINIEQIKGNFEKLPLKAIGESSKFIKSEKKLTAQWFVLSFFQSFSEKGEVKSSTWVQNISKLINQPLSLQGFNKRLGWLCIDFCEQILSSSLKYSLEKAVYWQSEGNWLKLFNRVLVEDSTCLKLPALLYSIFGGNTNQKGDYAQARIQVRLELGTEKIHHIGVKTYGENDLSFASQILNTICKGDLIIRDLGYFVIDVFEQIQDLGAYFISRWNPICKFVCPKSLKPIDLGDLLCQSQQKGIEILDLNLLLGLKKQFMVRVVAIKVPQEVEDKRRAKAEKKKNAIRHYSQAYFEHLGWSIYITNIPCTMLKATQIWHIYRLRWRIEIIFKAWKSHLNMASCLKDKNCLNPCHIIIRLYLMMAWIVLCLIPAYNYFLYKIYQAEKRTLSLAKFTDYYCNNFSELINELLWDKHIPFIKCFCLYEKRKNGSNYFENLYILNSC